MHSPSSDPHESTRRGDFRIIVVVELRNVPRVQPPKRVDCLRRLGGHVHVSHKDVATAVSDLAGAFNDLTLSPREGAAAGSNLPLPRDVAVKYIIN